MQLHRAAGHDLLGRLEEQPHPAGQQAPVVHLASASAAPTSAAVCTSCPHAWATPVDGAAPGVVGQVLHRQRVHVGSQRDDRPVGAEVGDQARAVQPG